MNSTHQRKKSYFERLHEEERKALLKCDWEEADWIFFKKASYVFYTGVLPTLGIVLGLLVVLSRIIQTH